MGYPLKINLNYGRKMRYSLIAVDVDGTLLNSSSQLSFENLAAIERLSKRGITVAPVTGRTYYEIPEAVRNCKYIRYFVYSNGSGIFDKERGTVYSSTVPTDIARKVFALLDSYETYIEIYSGCYPHADKSKINDERLEYYNVPPAFRRIIAKSRKTVEDFDIGLAEENLKPELFNAFFRDEGERAECFGKLQKGFPELEIVSSLGNNIEIMNRKTNKGTGTLKLCELLKISTDEIIALGDSDNDFRLFEIAARRCAVSNAREGLKAMATDIICSNNEHVIEFVEKNILC